MRTEAGELMIEAAKLLYGEHWITALSREIGVSERTLRAITEQRFDATGHPMVRETLELLNRRHQETARFLNRLQRMQQQRPTAKPRVRTPVPIP